MAAEYEPVNLDRLHAALVSSRPAAPVRRIFLRMRTEALPSRAPRPTRPYPLGR